MLSETLPSPQLFDNYGRIIDYLRLSITDRCNLRCRYCRPESGVPFIPHEEILSFEELERLVQIFCSLGIRKVRVTGGEPFSRRGCLHFLRQLKKIEGIESLFITSNGVKTYRHLDALADLGLSGINLSLDTLEKKRFWTITRRDYLESVMRTFHNALKLRIPLKVNSVVLSDTSDEEIMTLAGLAQKYPITIRFIERMPFSGAVQTRKYASGKVIQRLGTLFPELQELAQDLPTTARTFALPGFRGKLGIIEGYSRLFCSTCNKVRITPDGTLKTCLYDKGALNLKKMLRAQLDDTLIREAILNCIQNRFKNGHEAEYFTCREGKEQSMSSIGG